MKEDQPSIQFRRKLLIGVGLMSGGAALASIGAIDIENWQSPIKKEVESQFPNPPVTDQEYGQELRRIRSQRTEDVRRLQETRGSLESFLNQRSEESYEEESSIISRFKTWNRNKKEYKDRLVNEKVGFIRGAGDVVLSLTGVFLFSSGLIAIIPERLKKYLPDEPIRRTN